MQMYLYTMYLYIYLLFYLGAQVFTIHIPYTHTLKKNFCKSKNLLLYV